MPSSRPVSRRLLLTGAAGSVGVAAASIAGTDRLRSVFGLRAEDDGGPVYETFASKARGIDVTWGYAIPPDHGREGLPVVLVLHGRGDDAHSPFEALGMHHSLAQHVTEGGSPFAVVSVDGGETYWHPRKSGDDPLSMLEDELLPRLAKKGFDTQRMAVMGYSMGGYGALLLARQSTRGRFGAPGQVVAAAASSPALFASAGATSAGSFDDAGDYDRWGALAHKPGVKKIPLSVSCGTSDPFCDQTKRYRAACPIKPAGSIGPGGHTQPYWRGLVPDQFRFLAKHLTA